MMSWTSLGRYFQSRPLVSAVPGELQTDILSKRLPPWTADTRWTPDAPKRFTSTPDLLTRLLLSHCELTNIDARQAVARVSATPTECAQLGQVWSPVRALPPGKWHTLYQRIPCKRKTFRNLGCILKDSLLLRKTWEVRRNWNKCATVPKPRKSLSRAADLNVAVEAILIFVILELRTITPWLIVPCVTCLLYIPVSPVSLSPRLPVSLLKFTQYISCSFDLWACAASLGTQLRFKPPENKSGVPW